MRSRLAALLAALAIVTGIVTVASPAQADSWEYINCNFLGIMTTSYAYGSGGSAVYATGWRHYYDDSQLTGGSDCEDINVIAGYNGSGAATVRVQFCPDPDGKGPSFSCYSMGWGTIPDVPSCHCGTSAHDYHFPATNPVNWHFYYRVETLGASENIQPVV